MVGWLINESMRAIRRFFQPITVLVRWSRRR